LVDAMSAFGALPLDAREIAFDVLAASSNKCLEGVPGLGFVICRKEALDACMGNSPSLSLDLFDQFQALEKTGQWRFTPPVHCIGRFGEAEMRAALDAVRAVMAEMGVASGARSKRAVNA